jgi:hypothetical protein
MSVQKRCALSNYDLAILPLICQNNLERGHGARLGTREAMKVTAKVDAWCHKFDRQAPYQRSEHGVRRGGRSTRC